MPGCRKLDASSPHPASRGRVDLSAHLRARLRPPRAANDNRRASASRTWRWALLLGTAPVIGLLAALATLL